MSRIKKNDINGVVKDLELIFSVSGEFAPIYDSGSSLGREKEDDKIELLIKDSMMMEAYIRRGDAEIHWNGEKLNHFDLIHEINKEYADVVRNTIERIKTKYSIAGIQDIIQNIDMNLPSQLIMYKLPDKRKEFIIKLVTLRVEKLISINQ